MGNPYMVNSKSRAQTKTCFPLTEGKRVCTAYSDQRIIPGKFAVPRWGVRGGDMVRQVALQGNSKLKAFI
jgi:hypothetical protein